MNIAELVFFAKCNDELGELFVSDTNAKLTIKRIGGGLQ